ncbi:MAG: hypothetical protein ACLRQF_13165 [Thomasclavelia ramosa]
MNGLLLLALSMVALAAAYVIYGRYLEKLGNRPRLRHQRLLMKMGLILFLVANGKYLHISFHQSLEQDL